TTTTYSNAPTIGPQVAASGAFPTNAYALINVTSLLRGTGLLSWAVRRGNVAAVAFNSREAGANAPQLVVESVPGFSPPTISADALPTWQINGVVWSQVLVNN